SKNFRATICKLLAVLTLVLVLGCISTSAQSTQQAESDSARILIFNNLEAEEPSIAVLLNNKVLAQDVTTVSPVIERAVVPGEYTLTLTNNTAGTDTPMFDPIPATLEADHIYVVFAGGAWLGTAAMGTAFVDLIPLGQPPAPGATAPAQIVVANDVEGLSAV